MGLDLHTHSTASDGKLTPAELVNRAMMTELDGIALTDHDTVAGLDEAIRTGTTAGFAVIPGIELTTDYGDEEVHILGYGIDRNRPRLLEKLDKILISRLERAEGMLKRLERAGVHLTMEQIRVFATGEFVGRPHIYRAMKAQGIIGEDPQRKAFQHYLGTHGLAYLPHREIESLEAIELIRDAGGLPVLAHPGRMGRADFIRRLVEHGLAGLEVYYPSHTPAQIRQFAKLAKEFELIMTGGSDFHGDPDGTALGVSQASREFLEIIREKCPAMGN